MIWSLGLATALALCDVASASTATVTVTATSFGQSIYLLKDGTATQAFAGGIVISVNSASTSTLCADLFTNIALNDNYQANLLQAQYLNPSQTARGYRAAYLFLTQYGQLTSTVTAGNSTITLNQAMAALQLAVWDIVHDGGDGLSAGRIRSSSVTNQTTSAAIRNAANQYIQFSLNYQNGPVNATLYQHVNGPLAKQQLIGAWRDGTGPGIPEPSTYLLTSAGAGVLAWRHRRRRRN
jgi:hypothetical protein